MSPTASSKHRQSNQKKKGQKVQPQNFYTIEDLEGHKTHRPQEVSKKLDMDNIPQDQRYSTQHQHYEDEEEEKEDINKFVEQHIHENYATAGRGSQDEFSSARKVSPKKSRQITDSHEKPLKGNFNTPGFNTQDVGASKLSTIEKFDDSKKYNDNEIEEIVHSMSSKKGKAIPKTKIEKRGKSAIEPFSPQSKKTPLYQTITKQETPVAVSKPKLSSHIQKQRSDSPIKDESSKGHHEMVSLLNNPNMLFNDASSIKYSVDNQNMSNFSIPSITGEAIKPKFDCLDGMCYDLISAFVGDKFPTFIFTNKQVCNTFLDFQLEINEEVLNALKDRADQSISYSLQSLSHMETANPKDTMKKLKSKTAIFSLSDSCHEKFCEAIQQDIPKLMEILSNYALKKKDIVIMKLYFSFMGRKFTGRHDNLFMRQTHRFLYDNRHDIEDALDPILHFKFTSDVMTQVKGLLGEFLNQSFVDSEISDLSLLDSFTAIIIEALQYCDLIPAPEENEESREVKQQIDLIQKMKDHLSRLKEIVQ